MSFQVHPAESAKVSLLTPPRENDSATSSQGLESVAQLTRQSVAIRDRNIDINTQDEHVCGDDRYYDMVVEASGNTYYQLKDGCEPSELLPYTVTCKQGSIDEDPRYVCLEPGCGTKGGFRHLDELQFHYSDKHNGRDLQDCPERNCHRKGLNGFHGQDQLAEHVRMSHRKAVPE